MIGVLGVIDDVGPAAARTGSAADGAQVYLLGDTRDELGGSEWAHAIHGFLGGRPPAVDFARERALAEVLIAAARDGLLDSAHDLAEGGLAQALVECAPAPRRRRRASPCPPALDPFVALFSESTGARPGQPARAATKPRFAELCAAHGVPRTRIGQVDLLVADLDVQGSSAIPLRELRAASAATLPARASSDDPPCGATGRR